MPLERVLPRMRRLAGAAPPQPGLMEFDWADLAGDTPLLPQELRAAVRDAATVDPAPGLHRETRLNWIVS